MEVSASPVIDSALALPAPAHRRFARTELVVGIVLLALVIVVGLAAPLLTPYDPYTQHLDQRLLPPAWYEGGTRAHWLGTDALGRDYLTRLMYGARVSLVIGGAVTVLSGLIGCSLGLAAGFFGGRVDGAVTFVLTVRLALPVVLVVLAVAATIGSSALLV